MMKMYGVGRKAIRRDFDIIGEELPVITKQGYDGGYLLADGVGQHQNTLTQEQLECLEKVAVACGSEDRRIVLSIIHEFGPYCGSFT
jgi:predicted DNA-binding transcriptional regulator YafY